MAAAVAEWMASSVRITRRLQRARGVQGAVIDPDEIDAAQGLPHLRQGGWAQMPPRLASLRPVGGDDTRRPARSRKKNAPSA